MLALYVQTRQSPAAPSGTGTDTGTAADTEGSTGALMQRSVQKLQTLAALLATTVLWVSASASSSPDHTAETSLSETEGSSGQKECKARKESEEKEEGEEREELLALAEACQQCRAHVQQQISSFRVLGAALVHTPLITQHSGQPSVDISQSQNSLAALFSGKEEEYFHSAVTVCAVKTSLCSAPAEQEEKVGETSTQTETESETEETQEPQESQENSDNQSIEKTRAMKQARHKMDATSLKLKIFSNLSAKLQSRSAESDTETTSASSSSSSGGGGDAGSRGVAALLELVHLCVMAVELLDSSSCSYDDQEKAGREVDEEGEGERVTEVRMSRSSSHSSSSSSGAEDDNEDNSRELYTRTHAVLCQDREAESRRHCSAILSELLTERHVTSGGSFQEQLFSEEFKEGKEEGKLWLELETVSELMQVGTGHM